MRVVDTWNHHTALPLCAHVTGGRRLVRLQRYELGLQRVVRRAPAEFGRRETGTAGARRTTLNPQITS